MKTDFKTISVGLDGSFRVEMDAEQEAGLAFTYEKTNSRKVLWELRLYRWNHYPLWSIKEFAAKIIRRVNSLYGMRCESRTNIALLGVRGKNINTIVVYSDDRSE